MNRSDGHVLALAVLVSPVAVTGLGLAISRGHGEAVIVAVMVVGGLIAYLSRHRIRSRSGNADAGDAEHVDGGRRVDVHETTTVDATRR
jgi:hypothetical protein